MEDGLAPVGPPSSVLPQKAALCAEIVRGHFGKVPGALVQYVLGHGAQNMPELLRQMPHVSRAKMRDALKVLVQHNCLEPCVHTFTVRGVIHKVVEYQGLSDSILRRSRFPHFVDLARRRCGDLPADLMEIIFMHGRVSLHQLMEYARHKKMQKEEDGAGDAVVSVPSTGQGTKEGGGELDGSGPPPAKRGRGAGGKGAGAPAEGGALPVLQWHLRVTRAFEVLVRERFIEQSPRWGANGLMRNRWIDLDAEGVPPPSAPRKKGRSSEKLAAEALEARRRREAHDKGVTSAHPFREEYQLPPDFRTFADGLAAQVEKSSPQDMGPPDMGPPGAGTAGPKAPSGIKVKTEPQDSRYTKVGRASDIIVIPDDGGSNINGSKKRKVKNEKRNFPSEFLQMEDWQRDHPTPKEEPVRVKKETLSAAEVAKVDATRARDVTIENFSELWRVSLVEFVRRERHALCRATVTEKFTPMHGKAIGVLLDMARPYETAIRADRTAKCSAAQLLKEIKNRHAKATRAAAGAGAPGVLGSGVGGKRKSSTVPDVFIAQEGGADEREGSPNFYAEFESFDEKEMNKLLNTIVASSVGFMERVSSSDADEEVPEVRERAEKAYYTLRLDRIIDLRRQRYTECEVKNKFGRNGCRIFRILLKLRMLEQKTITEKAMLAVAETRELLYRMLPLEYISLQEISRTPEHAPSRSFYLWTVQMDRVIRAVQCGLFQCAMRLRMRLAHELKAERKLVELLESTDPGGITIAQASEEHEKLMRVERQLSVQLQRLDPMIALFNDF